MERMEYGRTEEWNNGISKNGIREYWKNAKAGR
jgi:hypothetical protein